MRNNLIKTIYELMEKDENIYFLTGDLGFHALEDLKVFNERFINCGIAEQNMIGVAAGLAKLGKKVFVYSIVPFVTSRCFEQIRNDVAFHNFDVNIIGIGAGLTYGVLGKTHYGLEDLGLLRLIPNMKVFIPADGIEVAKITEQIYIEKGPSYISVGRYKELEFDEELDWQIGKPVEITKGKDIVIFSCGDLIWEVKKACKILTEKYDISSSLINVSTLNPIDKKSILKFCKNKKRVFVIDEHFINGGIGSLIAEILSLSKIKYHLEFIGIDKISKKIGDQNYLRDLYSLSSEKIVRKIVENLCI